MKCFNPVLEEGIVKTADRFILLREVRRCVLHYLEPPKSWWFSICLLFHCNRIHLRNFRAQKLSGLWVVFVHDRSWPAENTFKTMILLVHRMPSKNFSERPVLAKLLLSVLLKPPSI